MNFRLSILLPAAALLILSACKKDSPDPPPDPPSGGGGAGSVTDQNGNTYATIAIGTQEWFAENLRATSYANGDPIPNVTDATEWIQLTTGAWAHYNNNSQFENPYGKLYNWYAVADPRNVCPNGWHVSTDEEWTVLRDYLGGDSIAGGKMKTTGTQYWQPPNTGGTNESGFSALPVGYRRSGDGNFLNRGFEGSCWSALELNADFAWAHKLDFFLASVQRLGKDKREGSCVRCVRD